MLHKLHKTVYLNKKVQTAKNNEEPERKKLMRVRRTGGVVTAQGNPFVLIKSQEKRDLKKKEKRTKNAQKIQNSK